MSCQGDFPNLEADTGGIKKGAAYAEIYGD